MTSSSNRRSSITSLSVPLAGFLMPAMAWGQSARTAQIRGVVADQSGAVVQFGARFQF